MSGSFCAAGAFGGGASALAFGQSQPAASGAFSFGSTPAFGQVQVPEPLQAACSARCIPGVALQLAGGCVEARAVQCVLASQVLTGLEA